MQKLIGQGKSPLDINSKEISQTTRKSLSQSLSPIQSSRRHYQSIKGAPTKAVIAITHFQKSRILPFLPQIPKLNAANDAKDILYSLKRDYRIEPIHNVNRESIYYRLKKSNNNRKTKNISSNFFDSFVDELVNDSNRSINQSQKAEDFVESFPELNFMQDLHKKVIVFLT